MTCQNCVRHVNNALLEVSGVQSVDVSLENGTARISSESILDQNVLRNAIRDAGYEYVARDYK
jgi:copper chaperone CopZ